MTSTTEKTDKADSKKSRQRARDQRRQQQRDRSRALEQRRQETRKEREQRKQRTIYAIVGGAVAVVAVVLLAGVLYEQVWRPSQPVARVNDTTLTLGDYWQVQQDSLTAQIIQNLQLLALTAGQEFSSQFAGQSPGLNQQIVTIRNNEPDQVTIDTWEESTLIEQGAADLGVSVDAATVEQAIVADLGEQFAIAPAADPATDDPAAATDDDGDDPADPATDDPADPATDDPAAATDDGEPTATATPFVTATPVPTPDPNTAATQLPSIIETLYTQYTTELELSQIQPALNEADFERALRRTYGDRALREAVQATLVTADSFVASEDPTRITARHILLAVAVPPDASDAERDAAFAERRTEAEAIREQLADGADFAELVTEFSDDPGSVEQGGNVGTFDRDGFSDTGGQYAPEFVAAAFALEGDAISEPVRTAFGWHLIQVTDRTVPTEDEQLQTARSEAFTAWLEQQRTASTVEVLWFTPTPTLEGGEAYPPPEEVTPAPTFVPGPPTPLPTPDPAQAPPDGAPDGEGGNLTIPAPVSP